MTDVATFLMFEKDAEEACKFYVDTIKGATLDSPMMFSLGDQHFYSYNGGEHFKFTEATSILLECKDQDEVDYYWDKLVEGGGEHSKCGWLKDRFGLSWQIIPTRFFELVSDDQTRDATMQAMLKMTKFDIAELEAAAKGE